MSVVVYVAAAAAILGRGNSFNIYNYSSSNKSTGGLSTPRRVQQVLVSPPLNCGEHVVEYLHYLDKDKPKVHYETCAYFGNSHPPAGPCPCPCPCPCPPKQTWASLDALIGRLRATFREENGGGSPEMNPFGAPAVRLYLREMRDAEAKAREIAFGKMTVTQIKKPQKSAIRRLFSTCL